ncbi:MAG: YezD family protein [Hyphomicrobiales bacterium]
MNTSDGSIVPRWIKERSAPAEPSQSEQAVLSEVLRALRSVRFGNIDLAIPDGRVVQINVTEKTRL